MMMMSDDDDDDDDPISPKTVNIRDPTTGSNLPMVTEQK